LRGFDQVGPIEPENLLAVAGAGLTVAELDEALAPAGVYWPVTGPHSHTLGGLMGLGLLGAETMAKGTMVDWILGTTMLAATGHMISSGGKTLKNVSGYDLTRLGWRARGSLGMSTSFILKLLPRPEICPVMEFRVRSLKLATDRLETIINERIGVQSLRLIADKNGLRVAVWMTGFTELVTTQEVRIKSLLKDPCDLFEDGFEYFTHSDAIFNLPHDQVAVYAGSRHSLLDTITKLSWIGDYGFVLDLGGGRLALTTPPGHAEAQAVQSGLVTVSASAYKACDPLFRRVKAGLDPKGVFFVQ
jgi:FAD/FMN-containing dehydrogenase